MNFSDSPRTPTPSLAVLPGPPGGYNPGLNPVTREGEPVEGVDTRMDFAIVQLGAGEVIAETHAKESAWILLHGDAELGYAGRHAAVQRDSLFDEAPSALHLGPGTPVKIQAGKAGAEWAIVRTTNDRTFTPRLFLPADLAPEYRGLGLVQDACLRNVRLVFDLKTRPESNLVIGEVVNYPGRWSSYPPHHHAQPEIYHYRFTHPSGYGHAELGEQVVKVRTHDSIVIPPGLDHAQVSAPGYGMYYLWMIRHLPGQPYTGFTFTPEHMWTLDPTQQGWKPTDTPKTT